ncbi:3-isopropylmalate dehydratase [Ruminococcaceae bacterium OttesenSCG-928-D13]|nr:3-isopropylmalate dehydratase [Ruminococcaceae bacterium OttesenSCG-928-D13]
MQPSFKGKVWVLGDDIDTDIIIPTDYLALPSVAEMAPYAFSPLRPELAGQIKPGDIIVGGKNFGCGSSREQAPEIIKALGVACVLAKSYARIFFRNAVNNGLLLLENPDLPDAVKEGDEVEVTPGVAVRHAGKDYPLAPMADNVLEILSAGGLVQSMKKRNGLA